jgi:hypothetical protein
MNSSYSVVRSMEASRGSLSLGAMLAAIALSPGIDAIRARHPQCAIDLMGATAGLDMRSVIGAARFSRGCDEHQNAKLQTPVAFALTTLCCLI